MAVLLFASTAIRANDQGLGRTWAKLDQDKKLTIGYFGGSITVGAGASKLNETSWRALTTAWFRKQFPAAQVTEVSAAIGGTGSNLGVYRCGPDLLSKHPDLVFVEFSVNDHGFAKDQELRWTEGIVRQIWHANPAADIVFVYTAGKPYYDAFYSKGTIPDVIQWQQQIADHYGIATVNVGKALCDTILAGKGTWETLTRDGIHPLDNGYAIYEQTILGFLQAHRQDKPVPPVTTLPAAVAPLPIDTVTLTDASSLDPTGWTKDPQPMEGHYPHQLTANVPGTSLDFPFHGSAIGLYWLAAPDSGKIEYSIDSGAPVTVSGWDSAGSKHAHARYTILRDDLPPGDHVLHLKISADKDTLSTGNWTRLGAFFSF